MLSDAEDELRDEIVALRAALHRERRARNYRAEVQALLAQTADKVDPRGVADVIARGFTEIVQAGWVCVAFRSADDPNIMEFVFGPTIPSDVAHDWREAPLSTKVPMSDVLRGDLPLVELPDSSDFERWPLFAAEAERADFASFYCLPIGSSDGAPPIAAIGLAWPQAHAIDDEEQTLLDDIISASAPAFGRARRSATDHQVAQTLQTWLLPPPISEHEQLDVATLYLPGRDEMAVGGDWYDVVPLGESRSAFVIGDVVGHNVRAAAEMGQVRHVLASSLLLTGGDPALSFKHTDEYFTLRAGDTMATAIVMVIDIDDWSMTLSSAGHLLPIVSEPGRASRLLEARVGPPIGAGLGGYTNAVSELSVGTMVAAFTDGVVERRGEVIDDSLGNLCGHLDAALAPGVTDGVAAGLPNRVVALLDQRVRAEEADDDAAALVFRRR